MSDDERIIFLEMKIVVWTLHILRKLQDEIHEIEYRELPYNILNVYVILTNVLAKESSCSSEISWETDDV